MSRKYLLVVACTVALALNSGPAAADPCTGSLFAPRVPYTAGGASSHDAVFADLNGDGILDLAVANGNSSGGSGNVGVRLGLADGTLGSVATFAANNGPYGLAAGDLDGDGKLDLAVANVRTSLVSILHGNGNGTFAAPVHYEAGNAPYNIAIADFNGDGRPDLAVADNSEPPTVNVLLNDGTGLFLPRVAYAIANVSTGITSGDVDGDGDIDVLATANYAGVVELLRGNGDGSFTPAEHIPANTEPFDVALADLDADGALDIVSGDAGYNGIAVMRGDGHGAFSAPVVYGNGSQDAGIAIGDWNHDGVLDVAGADGRSNVMRIFLGQTSGGAPNATFGPPTVFTAGRVSFTMTSGDLNRDGALDLLTVDYTDGGVSLFYGLCSNTPPPPPPPPPVEAPRLNSVRDVPHDQGGRVFLTWLPSSHDQSGDHSVTAYRVWRRIHPAGTLVQNAAPLRFAGAPGATLLAAGTGTSVTYWEALVDLPAQQLEGYGYTSATTQDSLPDSNPYTAFFVTALTSNSGVFWSSAVDSGYSVDNLPPQPPQGLTATHSPSGYSLTWSAANTSLDPDVIAYRVYRSNAPGTPDSSLDLAGTTTTTDWTDPDPSGAHNYDVVAVDSHGNTSPPSTLAPSQPVAVPATSPAFALHAPSPNPARGGRVAIAFALHDGSAATLELFDTNGRLVAQRSVGALGAGEHVVTLATALRPGVYAARLVQGAHRATTKLAVVR